MTRTTRSFLGRNTISVHAHPREEAGFVGDERRRLFLYSHLPIGPARGALVVCPSIGAEFRRNYGREVLLARALASRGIAVLRFHYRGMGASDGASEEMTLGTMIADACSVAETASAHATHVAFLGTRLGASVAAAAAAAHPGAPLAVWDPVADFDAYLRELQRSRLVRDLRAGRRSEGFEDELRTRGRVDILGYRIGGELVESLRRAPVYPAIGERHVLVVSVGRRNGPNAGHAALAGRFRDQGADVEVRWVGGYSSWWLYDPHEITEEKRTGSAELVAPTAAWLESHLGGAG